MDLNGVFSEYFVMDSYQRRTLLFLLFRYTQRTIFEILLIQPEIRLYLPLFRLIWNQTAVRLVQNQSGNGKYNLISG